MRVGIRGNECAVAPSKKRFDIMKTQIRLDAVRFGTVTQCGRHWAFVRPTDGSGEVRLYWSQLRRVESVCGGIIFSTGQEVSVHKGDKVAFVPQETGLWLWTFQRDFEEVQRFLHHSQVSPAEAPLLVAPLPTRAPAPEINLEAEMAALGSARVSAFQRRYAGYRGGARQVV